MISNYAFAEIFADEDATCLQAEIWTIDGLRPEVASKLQTLGFKLEIVDEPGDRLLVALPSLEEAIEAIREGQYPHANVELQRLSDPSSTSPLGTWTNLARGENMSDGVLRWKVPGRSPWIIVRSEIARELRTYEERAIAWWAELARKERTRLIYHVDGARLALPASRLPPPVLVERALIWADGHLPDFDPSDLSRCYRSITRRACPIRGAGARHEIGGSPMNDPLKLAEELTQSLSHVPRQPHNLSAMSV